MKRLINLLLSMSTPLLSISVLSATPAVGQESDIRGDVITLGYLENVKIGELGLSMKGKLDTGADTSSVYARDIEVYRRSSRDNWVKFRLVGKNGRSVRYNQNVIRFARIKTKTGGTIKRPVIHLPICIGGQAGLAEINLADRSDFDFDVLIGREFLAHRIIVDSGQTYAADANCDVVAEETEEEIPEKTASSAPEKSDGTKVVKKESSPKKKTITPASASETGSDEE